ncbi:beta-galactosidase [Capsulimonas corticalis]|uniref:Beta-galactosidase n=1 Tax=Capsulimonas corticalis TaxID=2219043 RepID=A0A402CUL9_9BACT|nr:beta-galactosidase GalA [Capsulimonas corticalis]BDI29022.1 beta-galactosidase [Capsulimonas corticalis]
MNKYRALALLWAVTACGAAHASPATPHSFPATPHSSRERIRIDADWRFHLTASPLVKDTVAIEGWRWTGAAFTDEAHAILPAGGDDRAWAPVKIGENLFTQPSRFVWLRTTLPSDSRTHRLLHFDSVDDNATVFLNGKRLLHHDGWDVPFNVPLDAAWSVHGPNVVTVLLENVNGPGGLSGATSLGHDETLIDGDPSRPAFDDRKWRTVHLPHDYIIEQAFTPLANVGHGSLPVAPAWYRKTFTIPKADKGKSLWIDFDGVYRDCAVWLNGHPLGRHPSGYTTFRYDIAPYARCGAKNVLAVSVDPTNFEGWWYEGGGIYRHVWLNAAAPLHVAPWGVAVDTTLPEPRPGSPAAPAGVTIKTHLNNDGANAASTIVSKIVDASGKTVAESSLVTAALAKQSKTVTQQVTIAQPHLWSLETPYLYQVVTEIRRNGAVTDTQETSFGVRTLRFDVNKGFFLNGRHVEIQGTCNHQDFAGVGIGMPDSLLYWRVKRLKEMGGNAYRMSHNPPAPELLDACDKLGMLVMDETRHLGDTYATKSQPGTKADDLSDLASMIQRDRNHPSIIMWSMSNEEPLQGTEEGAKIFVAMRNVVHKYDTTRPVTSAMNYAWGTGISLVEDLQGFNYFNHVSDYDDFHKAHPAIPAYASETSSGVSDRDTYEDDKAKGYVNEFDYRPWFDGATTAEQAWRPIADRPFMAGAFVWTGFDYKGEPTPYGWPCVNSHFGSLDMAGFPKDEFYYYQSVWSGKPMVHILPHWNRAGQEGKTFSVWCYSSADKVELFLNGQSLGAKDVARNSHVTWQVPYAPGTLLAKGYRNGAVIAADKVETTGAPARLVLKTDRTTLLADGEDVTMVEVDVVDAQGRIVPTANDLVHFALTGPAALAGVGNGDPSSHEPDQAPQRHAWNGRCLVIVRGGDAAGAATLAASAPGLTGAMLGLRVR